MVEMTGQELLARYASGERDFRGVHFTEVSNFAGKFVEVDFTGANFQFAEIDRCRFEYCNLTRVNFRGSNIQVLTIKNCIVTQLNLTHIFGHALIFGEDYLREIQMNRIELNHIIAKNCDLSGVDISESYIWDSKFSYSILEGAKFTWSYIENGLFEGADFTRADLRGIDLRRSNMKGADLTGANLRCAILNGVNLTDACLDRASLYGARLEDTVLCNTSLLGTNGYRAILRGADLTGAKTVLGADLDAFNRDYFLFGALLWNTILPNGELATYAEWTRNE